MNNLKIWVDVAIFIKISPLICRKYMNIDKMTKFKEYFFCEFN